MCVLDVSKHRCKLKGLRFKNRHKPYTIRLAIIESKIIPENFNFKILYIYSLETFYDDIYRIKKNVNA